MDGGSGLVNIRIYNEIGELVDKINEYKSAGGPQSSSINISKFAPGVYIYLVKFKYDNNGNNGGTKKYYKRKFVVIH